MDSLEGRRHVAVMTTRRLLACGSLAALIPLAAACSIEPDGEPTLEDAPALSLSNSKLGIHILGIPTADIDRVLAKCPRVIKVFPEERLARDLIFWYRSNCPGGQVVLRVFIPRDVRYGSGTDPFVAADDMWWRFMAGPVMSIEPSWVDWVEGPNELDSTDNWYVDPGVAQWFAAFWSRLADQINYYGYHPLVGSIATGNPSLAHENGFDHRGAMGPLADVMKSKPYRIGWSYHSYALNPYDPGDETWVTLRYRMIRDQAGLHNFPLVITEGGIDVPGWRARGVSEADYSGWLAHFDRKLREDSYVTGVTLFTIGSSSQSGELSQWDLGPVSDELALYLAQ